MPPERPPPPYCPGAPPPYNPSHTVYPAGPAPPAGAAPYGVPPPWGAFYSPPPAYHQGFPEGYPAGYPPGYPPPSQPDGPPMNPGGYSLYPDVSLLPQPEAGKSSHTDVMCNYIPNSNRRPDQYGLNGILSHSNSTPHQLSLHNNLPNPYPELRYGILASPSVPVQSYPDTLLGDIPYYGSEAPQNLPTAPPEPPPPYEANCFTHDSPSTAHTNLHVRPNYAQAQPPSCVHPRPTSGPTTSTDTKRFQPPVPLGFVQGGRGNPTPPKFSPRIPVRPAPAPPCQSPGDLTSMGPPLPDHTSTGPVQNTNELPLKEGEAPPGCVVAWRGGEGLKVFFLQQEGHIVSPHRPLLMTIYKKIGGSPCEGNENLVGMVEVPGCWRLRLTGSTHVLHTSENAYIFNDNSTCPKRVVVLELPANVSKTMEADLLALMNELTDLRDEEEGVVGKIATGVSTVYTDLTKKLNTVVKETVPGAHKSTKWLRKGTGSLVRMGGSIVSKGIHMIADHVSVNENPQEDSPVHTELLTALKQVKKCKEDGFITYV
ncbi:extensin-2-like isoform X2 [Homarus americanus]|uniref:extensin-2-like isoform X2 n=1 Tax=Homarus americanus TaxID=6706 RepID=UPI001C473780|nr:extensin-2-like isoform X2 [Homarus americanus]